MILTKETLSAGPKIGTGEGVAHSKRWYVALVRMHHEKKVAERLECATPSPVPILGPALKASFVRIILFYPLCFRYFLGNG